MKRGLYQNGHFRGKYMNKNKKYVIFEAQHLSGLYQFLTLRFNKFKDEDVVLFVNKADFSKSNFANELIKNKVFSKVVSFNEPLLKYGELSGLEFINKFFNDIFDSNELEISDIKEVVTGCDVQNLFAIFCMSKKIELSFMELHTNQFVDKNRYEINRVYASAPVWVEELSKKFSALSGDSKDVKKRFLYKGSPIEYKGKDTNVDFLKEFYSMDTKYKEQISRCLDIENCENIKNCDILLINSLGWSKPTTKLELPYHYLPYLLLADYYFKDNLILKDHPQTPKEYFLKNIKTKFNTLNSEIPIELFGLVEGFHIDNLISVNSTGNDKISHFVNREVKLGVNYLENFREVHKTYITFLLEKMICKDSNYHALNINTEYLTNFKKFNDEELTKEILGINPKILRGNIFTIINRPNDQQCVSLKEALINADRSTKVVFWNIDLEKLIDFDNIDLLENFLEIRIYKSKNNGEDTLSDLLTETIYFYCKDKEVLNKVTNTSFEKELKHTGIKIRTQVEIKDLINLKCSLLLRKVKEQELLLKKLNNK